MVLAIPFAANIGGMGTVIGTPPNAVLAGAASEMLGVEIGFWGDRVWAQNVDFTRGETSSVTLEVPPGVQVNRITSPSGAVADWRMGNALSSGARQATVFLDRKVDPFERLVPVCVGLGEVLDRQSFHEAAYCNRAPPKSHLVCELSRDFRCATGRCFHARVGCWLSIGQH